ncbi:unnamed protein product, partial [Laminaria digitata]
MPSNSIIHTQSTVVYQVSINCLPGTALDYAFDSTLVVPGVLLLLRVVRCCPLLRCARCQVVIHVLIFSVRLDLARSVSSREDSMSGLCSAAENSRVLYGYPSVHGAVFFNRKSYGP